MAMPVVERVAVAIVAGEVAVEANVAVAAMVEAAEAAVVEAPLVVAMVVVAAEQAVGGRGPPALGGRLFFPLQATQ